MAAAKAPSASQMPSTRSSVESDWMPSRTAPSARLSALIGTAEAAQGCPSSAANVLTDRPARAAGHQIALLARRVVVSIGGG